MDIALARTIRHRRDTVGDNSIRVHAAIVRDEFGVDITRFGRGQYALHSWLLIIQSKGFVEWPRSEGDRARLPILIGRTLGNTSEGMVQAASVAAESSRSAPLATAHKVKYYFFNGQRVAMERNGVFTYLHGDHLGSTIAETGVVGSDNGKIVNKREYNPYGSRRSGDTQLNTDRTYTGQQSDETGLMYYNARYYDPQIGHFISPDTIVPDPGNVLDYNRYMYVRGNAMKYNDPSGHQVGNPVFSQYGGGGGGAILAKAAIDAVAVALAADTLANNPPPSVPSAPDMPQEGFSSPAVDTSVSGFGDQTSMTGYDSWTVTTETSVPSQNEGFQLSQPQAGANILNASSPWLGDPDSIIPGGKVHTGRIGGYDEATSDLTGGLSGAMEVFEALTGRKPTIDNPSSRAPTDSYIEDSKIEVKFRPNSRTGTPVIEVIDHGAETYEKIHFNP